MNLMTNWADLGNPCPRKEPLRYTPLAWPLGRRIPLPIASGSSCLSKPIADVLLHRRTKREFSFLSTEMLGALTWLTCQTQQTGHEDLGFPLSLRPCPSAGAIHPIHLLVIGPEGDGWFRYDSTSHALDEMKTKVDPRKVLEAMHAVLPAPSATLLILAAEPERTGAKYEAPASLVWRDAGVILGVLAVAAEALDLSFCPLGVTGEPWVGQLLDQPGLTGVGAAFVGSSPS